MFYPSLEKEHSALSRFPQNEFPSGTSFWPVMCRFTVSHVRKYQQPVLGRKNVISGRRKLGAVSVPVMLGEVGAPHPSLCREGRAVPALQIADGQDTLLKSGAGTNAPLTAVPSFPAECTHSGTEVWKRGGKQTT